MALTNRKVIREWCPSPIGNIKTSGVWERIYAYEKQVEQLMVALRFLRRKQFSSASEKLGKEVYEQLSLPTRSIGPGGAQ